MMWRLVCDIRCWIESGEHFLSTARWTLRNLFSTMDDKEWASLIERGESSQQSCISNLLRSIIREKKGEVGSKTANLAPAASSAPAAIAAPAVAVQTPQQASVPVGGVQFDVPLHLLPPALRILLEQVSPDYRGNALLDIMPKLGVCWASKILVLDQTGGWQRCVFNTVHVGLPSSGKSRIMDCYEKSLLAELKQQDKQNRDEQLKYLKAKRQNNGTGQLGPEPKRFVQLLGSSTQIPILMRECFDSSELSHNSASLSTPNLCAELRVNYCISAQYNTLYKFFNQDAALAGSTSRPMFSIMPYDPYHEKYQFYNH